MVVGFGLLCLQFMLNFMCFLFQYDLNCAFLVLVSECLQVVLYYSMNYQVTLVVQEPYGFLVRTYLFYNVFSLSTVKASGLSGILWLTFG